MKPVHIDPLFFLHHAVCRIDDSIEGAANMRVAQMVDKVWYDWQHRNSSNEKAFGGGSVSVQVNATEASKYPTGAPPFLNVRGNPPS